MLTFYFISKCIRFIDQQPTNAQQIIVLSILSNIHNSIHLQKYKKSITKYTLNPNANLDKRFHFDLVHSSQFTAHLNKRRKK